LIELNKRLQIGSWYNFVTGRLMYADKYGGRNSNILVQTEVCSE